MEGCFASHRLSTSSCTISWQVWPSRRSTQPPARFWTGVSIWAPGGSAATCTTCCTSPASCKWRQYYLTNFGGSILLSLLSASTRSGPSSTTISWSPHRRKVLWTIRRGRDWRKQRGRLIVRNLEKRGDDNRLPCSRYRVNLKLSLRIVSSVITLDCLSRPHDIFLFLACHLWLRDNTSSV